MKKKYIYISLVHWPILKWAAQKLRLSAQVCNMIKHKRIYILPHQQVIHNGNKKVFPISPTLCSGVLLQLALFCLFYTYAYWDSRWYICKGIWSTQMCILMTVYWWLFFRQYIMMSLLATNPGTTTLQFTPEPAGISYLSESLELEHTCLLLSH